MAQVDGKDYRWSRKKKCPGPLGALQSVTSPSEHCGKEADWYLGSQAKTCRSWEKSRSSSNNQSIVLIQSRGLLTLEEGQEHREQPQP